MKPHYQDNHVANYNKDCRNMTELSGNSVQCVVTSPPYWGLRKYSGDQELIWGGDNHCEHEWGKPIIAVNSGGGYAAGKDYGSSTPGGKRDWQLGEVSQGKFCQGCGAWRGSFGLEPTPELYVQHTVEILREIKRVLRKDGVVFWNIGDSYYSSASNQQGKGNPNSGVGVRGCQEVGRVHLPRHNTLKPKDLMLIPFRVAIAAQEDGWYLRSDIIWSKPNSMPESVTDRPTVSHEHILMLTKSARYYWDQIAVSREYKQSSIDRADDSQVTTSNPDRRVGFKRSLGNGVNIRSVWEFPVTQSPFPGSHFAVFPEKLPETCIKAATPEEGCCAKCGAPLKRIVEHKSMDIKRTNWGELSGNRTASLGTMISPAETKTIGWQPTCKCNAETVPSFVLDPFAGAGTTLWVAKMLGRRSIGYELSSEYCDLIVERNRQQVFE